MSDVAATRSPVVAGAAARLLDALRAPAAVLGDDGHWRHVNPALAALLDGLVFTALVRGPHDPAGLAAWVRPPIERALAIR